MDEKELQRLYNAVNSKFDIGDYNTFRTRMQTPEDRKKFYDVVGSKGFDLGQYPFYEERLSGIKKKQSSDVGSTPLGSGVSKSQVTKDPLQEALDARSRQRKEGAVGNISMPRNASDATATNLQQKTEMIDDNVLNRQSEASLKKENEEFKQQALETTAKRSKRTKEEVKKDVDEGKLILSSDGKGNKIYARQPGAGETFIRGLVSAKRGLADAAGIAALKLTGTDEDLANYYEMISRRKKVESEKEFGLADISTGLPIGTEFADSFSPIKDLPTAAPTTLGSLTEMAGHLVPDGVLAAATGGSSVAAKTAILGSKMYASSYGNKAPELYEMDKHELMRGGMDEKEASVLAAKAATENAATAAIPDAAMNTLFFSGKLHSPAANNFISVMKGAAKDAVRVGGLGAATSGITSAIESNQGYDIGNIIDKMVESGGEFAKLDLLFKVLPILRTLPKAAQSAVKEFAVDPVVNPVVESYLKSVPEDIANRIRVELQDYKSATEPVRGVVPEEKMASLGGRMQKRQNRINGINIIKGDIEALEAKKKDLPETLHEEINTTIKEREGQIKELEKEIESVDKEIGEINKSKETGLEKEIDEATGEPLIPKEEPEQISQPIELSTEVGELKPGEPAPSPTVSEDVKVQDSEYKGIKGTTSVKVKEKDGIVKATFTGTRDDKPGAVIGASGYRYGSKANKETLSDFEKDYGVKVEDIIDGVDDISEITVIEERAEVRVRQGVGTGQSVTLRIKTKDGDILNDINIPVNKRKFTAKQEAKPTVSESEVELKAAIGDRKNIIYKGESVGYVEIPTDLEGDTYSLGDINIKPEFRNKGIGVEVYKQLINTLDKPLQSFDRTPEAKRVWESLVKQGLAKREGDGYVSLKQEAKPTVSESEVELKENNEVIVEGRKAFDINNKGAKVGQLSLEDNGEYYQVSNIKVNTPNEGIGTEAYRKLINTLDKPLVSDVIRSDSAEAVWKKLEKEGLAKFNEETKQYESVKQEAKPTVSSEEVGSGVGGDEKFTAKGGNKVVDEKGEPITVYHTTKAKNISEFKTSGEIETLGGKVKNEGAYFTPIKGEYANKGGYEYAVQISIKNPYITTDQIESAIISPEKRADLISKGHDGVILMRNGKPAEYVVFDKSQIKAVEQSIKETTKSETPTTTQESNVPVSETKGFTEGKDLNKIFADLKSKYGDKKGSALYDVANRLVNPNENTIVEVRGNGVVVKEGGKYILKPFGNTDANPKKWTLYKGMDVTDQFLKEQPSTPVSEGKTKIENEVIEKPVESTEPLNSKTEGDTKAEPIEVSEGGGEPPKGEAVSSGIYSEPKRTEFSHRGLQEVATEFGLDPVTSRERVSDAQLFRRADETLTKWQEEGSYNKNIKDLMKRGEEKKPISDEENVIMAQHIAQLREQGKNVRKEFGVNSKEYDAKLSEINDAVRVGEAIRSQQGAALRVPIFSREYMPTLEDAMTAKMDAVGTDVLTPKQKVEVEKQFEKIEKERDEYKAKLEAANAKFAEMQAQSELSKPASKGKTTTGKRDYKAERQSLKDRLKEEVAAYKAAGQKVGIASDGGAESFVVSAKIAKTITEIARTHVAETGAKIKEVVEKTLEDVKEYFGDKVTDRDIMDVLAGKYNEKRKTRSQLAADMREVQTEAKLLQQYESLLKKEPQSEKAKVEQNKRLKELRDKIKELQKEQGVGQYSEAEKAKRAIERNKAREKKIRDKITNKDYEPNPKPETFWEDPSFKKNHPDLYKKVLDSQIKMEETQLEYEKELIADEMARAGWTEKGQEIWRKTAGTVKHLFASFDFSGLAVQNLPMIMTNPLIGAKGIKMSAKDFASQRRFDRYIAELHNSADWKLMKDSGLRVSEPKSLLEEGRDQMFPDRFKAIVKIKGKTYGYMKIGDGKYELLDISKPFERQFVSLGNTLRVIKFRTEANKLIEDGYTFEKNPQEFEGLAKRINNLTSGADVPQAFQNPLTNTFIWSTRLMVAKLNMLGISDLVALTPLGKAFGVKKGYYQSLGVKGQKLSRQQIYAAADLAKFASTVMATTYLSAMAGGGKVNTDPFDDRFLDVTFKDGVSKNYTGGFSKYISFIFQLIRQGKSKDGKFTPYSGIKDRGQQVTHFLAGKAPPITRAVEAVAIGKDYTGKEATVGSEAKKFIYPMAIGQIVEQIKKDGLEGLFEQGIETIIGVGVKDERDYEKKDEGKQGMPQKKQKPTKEKKFAP